ncbi:hypothetical protein AKJ09_04208 [Labilithrix luteola]|uniref:Lipoprotein n=1 Tax=Labilithrix luteola TaxID=1391654 RepID=A0A0K1PWN0_9BACT|nr:hypothetical protein [Labilithrix luteola]AKU97544.1 hypothetical protein AKJ09_04208 [Labilithrix luteola]
MNPSQRSRFALVLSLVLVPSAALVVGCSNDEKKNETTNAQGADPAAKAANTGTATANATAMGAATNAANTVSTTATAIPTADTAQPNAADAGLAKDGGSHVNDAVDGGHGTAKDAGKK